MSSFLYLADLKSFYQFVEEIIDIVTMATYQALHLQPISLSLGMGLVRYLKGT